MNRGAANFNEIVALLWRNEAGGDGDSDEGQREQRDARDIEQDLRRLLLLSRDTKQRDQMVQAQAVRRVTNIAKQASNANGWGVQRCCAAILCNLAHSERGRLSASSCDRWQCVSHRHNCPLALLLRQTVTPGPTSDLCLRQLSAAALLSYSVQNECQTQLDLIEALPLLLRRLHDARDDAELRVFVAATLWNLTKSPLLLLKLETVHGILRDQLLRKLTDVLWTPLEPFQLSVTPTGERGTSGLLESDSAGNLGIMLAASVSSELSIVLEIENYVGRPRSLVDQFRAKTPLLGRPPRDASEVVEGRSVAQYDEAGTLTSRSCAVCAKRIKLRRRRKHHDPSTAELPAYLACARDGCEQTFHTACSRWRALAPERVAAHAHEFHCAACMLLVGGVHYCDFVADDARHELLVTEARFKSVAVQRVAGESDAAAVEYAALLDKTTRDVVAVGVKKYRIPSSSQDAETFVVAVRYVLRAVSPVTQQNVQRNRSPSPSPSPAATNSNANQWIVSFARDGALQLPVTAGGVVFWPGPFLQDLDASLYTQRSLAELESVFLYEFDGETSIDKTYSFGRVIRDAEVGAVAGATGKRPLPALWTTLYPRRGVCMKLLAEQIGHHKQLNELLGGTSGTGSNGRRGSAGAATTPTKKAPRKGLLPGRKHNSVAVATAGML